MSEENTQPAVLSFEEFVTQSRFYRSGGLQMLQPPIGASVILKKCTKRNWKVVNDEFLRHVYEGRVRKVRKKPEMKTVPAGNITVTMPVQKNEFKNTESSQKEGGVNSTSRTGDKIGKGKALMNQIEGAIAELEKRIEDPETEKKIREWLECQARFHNYSIYNTFWLYVQSLQRNMSLGEVASFRKWSEMTAPSGEKVCVNKGAKAFQIIFPEEFKIYQRDERGDYKLDEKGRKIPELDKNGEAKKAVWFGVGYVFDVSQTNAVEIGAVKRIDHRGAIVAISPRILDETAARITQEYGIPVTFVSKPGMEAGGWYDSAAHDITVNTAVSSATSEQLGTLFHELGHALIHGKDSASYSRNLKEGQAEAFAYAAASVFGIKRDSQFYIKGWIQDEVPLQDVLKAISGHVKNAFEVLKLHDLALQNSLSRNPLEVSEFTVLPDLTENDLRNTVSDVVNEYLDPCSKDVHAALNYIHRADVEKLSELYGILQDGRRENRPEKHLAALMAMRAVEMVKMEQRRQVIQEEAAQLTLNF